MTKFGYRNAIKLGCFTFIFSYFFSILFKSWSVGGRWDLNEQIAFGDRIIETGNAIYSGGDSDLFMPSSPYFPGVGMLSALFRFIGVNDHILLNKIMLAVAVLVGFILLVELIFLANKFSSSDAPELTVFWVVLFYYFWFEEYKYYMMEFKPDSILLVFSILIMFTLPVNKACTKLNATLVLTLLFVASFFKQSAFLIYLITSILVLQNNKNTKTEKAIILSLIGITGLIFLLVLNKIENGIYFSVTVMGEHPFLDFDVILGMMKMLVKEYVLLISLLVFCIVIMRQEIKKDSLQKIFLIFSSLWLIFSTVSMIKVGGNIGNFEAGFIVVLPFIALAINYLVKSVHENKIFKIAVLLGLIVINGLAIRDLVENYRSYKNYHRDMIAATEYLKTYFEGKYAFVDGRNYTIAKQAGIKVLTEFNTILHFVTSTVDRKQPHFKNAIKEQEYDLFIMNRPPAEAFEHYIPDKQIKKIFIDKYKLLLDENLPANLTGKIFIPIQLG